MRSHAYLIVLFIPFIIDKMNYSCSMKIHCCSHFPVLILRSAQFLLLRPLLCSFPTSADVTCNHWSVQPQTAAVMSKTGSVRALPKRRCCVSFFLFGAQDMFLLQGRTGHMAGKVTTASYV